MPPRRDPHFILGTDRPRLAIAHRTRPRLFVPKSYLFNCPVHPLRDLRIRLSPCDPRRVSSRQVVVYATLTRWPVHLSVTDQAF